MDPIHQFKIEPIVNLHPFGIDASFTNASLFMLIIVLAASALMILGTSSRSLIPGRLQSAAEVTYNFVADTVRMSAGHEGMKFFPFVFTLFLFIFFSNMIGLIPYTFTVTSQIIVTGAFAALVIGMVIVYGLIRHGTHFLGFSSLRACRRCCCPLSCSSRSCPSSRARSPCPSGCLPTCWRATSLL